jgi:hypothetical protein
MMEYADPQLTFNLSDISVTVIHVSSLTRQVICSTLSAICKVVGWPMWSSSMMLVFASTCLYYDCTNFSVEVGS